jgi:preprotein translocase subunit Sec63
LCCGTQETNAGGCTQRRQQLDPIDFFPAVNLTKAATASEIKKAYHRLALACHPDKHPDDPEVFRRNSKKTKTLIRTHKIENIPAESCHCA